MKRAATRINRSESGFRQVLLMLCGTSIVNALALCLLGHGTQPKLLMRRDAVKTRKNANAFYLGVAERVSSRPPPIYEPKCFALLLVMIAPWSKASSQRWKRNKGGMKRRVKHQKSGIQPNRLMRSLSG